MDLKQQYPSDIATFIEKKSTEGPFKFFYPKLSTIYLEDSYDLLIMIHPVLFPTCCKSHTLLRFESKKILPHKHTQRDRRVLLIDQIIYDTMAWSDNEALYGKGMDKLTLKSCR